MVDVSEDVWDALVALRQSRPLLARQDDERAAVLQAALRQAEELTRAASSIGLASRPILMYYAATQLARALCAAVLPDRFELHGHGVSFAAGAQSAARSAAWVKCAPKKDGTPTILGGFLGALGLALPPNGTQVTLADAWPTLYGGDLVPVHPDAPPAPEPVSNVLTRRLHNGGRYIALRAFAPWRPINESWQRDPVAPSTWRTDVYPTRELSRLMQRGELDLAEYLVSGFPGIVAATAEPPADPNYSIPFLLEVVDPPEMAVGEDGLWDKLVPAPVAMPQLVNGLPAWWLILFTCGSLARYEPATWGSFIDETTSEDAVALREAMRVAVDDVPRRFLAAFQALAAAST